MRSVDRITPVVVYLRPEYAAALCVCPKKYWWVQDIPIPRYINTLWGYTREANGVLEGGPCERCREQGSAQSLLPLGVGVDQLHLSGTFEGAGLHDLHIGYAQSHAVRGLSKREIE